MFKTIIGVGAVIGVLALGLATRSLWSPYFSNASLQESIPGLEQLSSDQQQVIAEMAKQNAQMARDTVGGMLEPDRMMSENSAPELRVLKLGELQGFDAIHQGTGTAKIIETSQGLFLRLENIDVTNGPQLHVVLSTKPTLTLLGGVGESSVDLGPLKANQGSHNYPLPADIDLNQIGSVSIYCVPYNVNFAFARLE